MRFAGRITDWNGERGFGFVVPHGGGDRAFVHVSEFQRGSRPPVVGDLISYEIRKDAKGRLNAKTIRFAGQKIEAPGKHRRIPRLGIALAFFLLVAIFTLFGKVPVMVSLAYLAVSLVSYVLYCLDKAAAEKEYRRIPETTLHFIDLLFGWPGGLVAQQQCRHKTAKDSFQRTFWLTVLLNLAGAFVLVASGIAQRLSSALLGA
ncbi:MULTISPECIES: DUF1294 domain-containing protein [unclassified Pseudoxanthomonas]|jgi:uncharacterized membrane protein YsdA (DUF1294 family)/cold shock CspA family protein|uniref:DUF1294 domain-containing protein n=1 Tax=unclassified Pseudoxanthomonas TaxID=2645906 RepID=UPI00161B5F7D|nr:MULTISPECIES: DUF1294 domain-containing protein [unclassified Pseudoxanthomonas]MBB3274987.1 uncharacterized membrane protein YsdA (DUF1294 family)/cold shock CspA family protein [Pseudoxanthomonas sp. OG2]MBV7473920.1 DUF1294 domain-containing protein [Pseudoxanthomonas sp. PXM05]